MDDHRWELMKARVDPAERLPQDRHADAGIARIWTCGAYYSRGRREGSPWSRVLRWAKGSTLEMTEEHKAALSLAAAFFCSLIVFAYEPIGKGQLGWEIRAPSLDIQWVNWINGFVLQPRLPWMVESRPVDLSQVQQQIVWFFIVFGLVTLLIHHLQRSASGRAMLARLPRAQVRALYPNAAAFTDRTGRGPGTPGELRTLLGEERRQGWSIESGQVTEGFLSVAAAAADHNGRPAAAISLTVPVARPVTPQALAARVRDAAGELTRRLSGRAGPAH